MKDVNCLEIFYSSSCQVYSRCQIFPRSEKEITVDETSVLEPVTKKGNVKMDTEGLIMQQVLDCSRFSAFFLRNFNLFN